ncbi:DUF3486 family protein [Xanthobacteraceae bacterium Astr-EGSB]|uniref:phage protein Gp27 family protein n=1 Tax=Astrobacterium formosum TaxID=3069710 RepID=UPI0027B7B155|nr:DUF3486 family protein [Xanthobacteraceae bacterium Astr-EGSB]
MARARRGRGRLSDIDQLPAWADEVKMWAFEQLKERKRTQLDICAEFNERLRDAAAAEGVPPPKPISKSALNRTSVTIALRGRRLEETREIAAVLAPRLDQVGDNSLTLLVAETIKTLISEMLGNAGELTADGDTAEMLMMTARALASAEQAKRVSSDTRRKIADELKSKAAKAVDAVAASAQASGQPIDGAAVLKKIREDIYGIFER